MSKKPVQRERKEQQWLVQWFRLKYKNILIAASANGGSRDCAEAVNMKREGVLAGIPDLQIFRAAQGYHGLFIEMKAPKTLASKAGVLSARQKTMLMKLNAEGYYARAAWGWLDGKSIIEWYLEEKK